MGSSPANSESPENGATRLEFKLDPWNKSWHEGCRRAVERRSTIEVGGAATFSAQSSRAHFVLTQPLRSQFQLAPTTKTPHHCIPEEFTHIYIYAGEILGRSEKQSESVVVLSAEVPTRKMEVVRPFARPWNMLPCFSRSWHALELVFTESWVPKGD